jgi:hypothetical protein
MLGYVAGDRQEARKALLAANRWLRTNPEDWPIREARDGLRQALPPAVLQPLYADAYKRPGNDCGMAKTSQRQRFQTKCLMDDPCNPL